MKSVEEVFFSKVSGEFFLEIFEKSIDKHEIDAILNRRPDSSGSLFLGDAAQGGRMPEDSEEESGEPSRYKDSDEEWPGASMCLCAWNGTVEGHCVLYRGVFFEKC